LSNSAISSFINLKSLSLDGEGTAGEDSFFATIAQSLQSLETLTLGREFKLNGQHLLEALKLPHFSALRSIVLNLGKIEERDNYRNVEDYVNHRHGPTFYIWPADCSPSTLNVLVALAKTRGITVTGHFVDAVRWTEQYESLQTEKKEVKARLAREMASIEAQMIGLKRKFWTSIPRPE
jgi:hypothetical protein